jgi:hypothetical protein
VPYDKYARIGKRLAERFGVERFDAPMMFEGGSIAFDGAWRSSRISTCATPRIWSASIRSSTRVAAP